MLSIAESPDHCEFFLATFICLLLCGVILTAIVVVVIYGAVYYGVDNEWLTYLLTFLLVTCLLSVCVWWRVEYVSIYADACFWEKNKDALCTPPSLHNNSII